MGRASGKGKTGRGQMSSVVQELFGAAPVVQPPVATIVEEPVATPAPEAPAKEPAKEPAKAPVRRTLPFLRRFTDGQTDPYDTVTWAVRSAVIQGEGGKDVFRQDGVEFPEFYSQTAVNVIASKYFRGHMGTPERERSLRQMISRVVKTLAQWAREDGYLDEEGARAFEDDLTWLVLHQYGSFNSPVWFNVGVEPHPQCSACFINSVEDTMESILGLARTEGMLFKFGSGTGTNFSPLRSRREKLRGGGVPSGPVSFMKGFDAFAGVIKSGGKTRRAAKMVILNVDHPDILEFVQCKVREEQKALALIQAGYSGAFGGEAYESVFFQNANNSVRVTDEFMQAVERDGLWKTRAVTTGEVVETLRAREVFRQICEAAWACGDPGLQFDTQVNDWHTCPASGRINASNPCSEFMFLDDSACNLASLNLMKFVREDGAFDTEAFRAAVRTFILAQEVIVSRSNYPTEAIGRNSERFRPLGLGYANLGALLMQWGLPYDGDAGRAMAATITALMTGTAYAASAWIAGVKGPFEAFEKNRDAMLRVIRKHRSALDSVPERLVPRTLMEEARKSFQEASSLGERNGYRNAQVTLLAPTGTIGFMMDCDTTGIEPELAIVKYKHLVGGGQIKIVNQSVPRALQRLGYSREDVTAIVEYLEQHDTIEGSPLLREEHLPVFDCAFRPTRGKRSISVDGHIRMMAAVQPFLSGAISKTVNLPADATVEDVEKAYRDAWRLGLKAVAIYRDGSKSAQPVVLKNDEGPRKTPQGAPVPQRRRLPDERDSLTHKFSIAGLDGYITVGMYQDGTPGEIFVTMAKQGSVISGLMDAFATAISIALQYGVPLKVLVDKFSHLRFEPAGYSSNPQIGYAKSILDYIFRWLALKFLKQEEGEADVREEASPDLEAKEGLTRPTPFQTSIFENQEDAPPCSVCGTVMVRNGACYKCENCGSTSGCS